MPILQQLVNHPLGLLLGDSRKQGEDAVATLGPLMHFIRCANVPHLGQGQLDELGDFELIRDAFFTREDYVQINTRSI